MSNIDTSKWEEFRIGDLFDIHPTKAYKMSNVELFNNDGAIPVLSNSSSNNGFGGFSDLDPTEDGNIITFSDTTTGADTMFYQEKPFIGYAHVQGMYPLSFELNERTALFLISAIRRAAGNDWDYANKFNRKLVAEIRVLLPVDETKWVPDWEYMEQYIAELEEERVAELEEERVAELDAYLKVTGLNNYELTDEDKAVLCMSDEKRIEEFVGDVIWKKVKIRDIFTSQSGDFDIKKEHINNKGVEVVSSGIADRGIIGKTDIKAREFKPQTLTVDMFGNVFYRNEPYKMATHARVFSLSPKFDIDNKIGEYLETKLKFLNQMFEYNNMCSFKKIQDLEIELPFDKDGNLHKPYIYISALEKIIVKDVILWKDRQLKILRKIV